MVDRDAVARVLGHYGLRPTGRMSARNGVVRIATTGGPKVLMRYPAERPTGSIASEHSILRRLEAIRFPAVRVGATTVGRRSCGSTGAASPCTTTSAGVR